MWPLPSTSHARAKVKPFHISPTCRRLCSTSWPEGITTSKEEKAILAASRKGRVDQTCAEEICNKLASQPGDANPANEADDDGEAEAVAAAAEDPEIKAILDGPPPEVPPAPAFTTPPNTALITFDHAVSSLKAVLTKLPAQFTGTAHSADDLEKVEAFIRAVIQARRPS
jgi:hypothetical protein